MQNFSSRQSNYTPLTLWPPEASILRTADRGAQGAHGQISRPLDLALTWLIRLAGHSGCWVTFAVVRYLVLALKPSRSVSLLGTGSGRCARPLFALPPQSIPSASSFVPSGSPLRSDRGEPYHCFSGFRGRSSGPLSGAPKAVASPFSRGTGGGPLR